MGMSLLYFKIKIFVSTHPLSISCLVYWVLTKISIVFVFVKKRSIQIESTKYFEKKKFEFFLPSSSSSFHFITAHCLKAFTFKKMQPLFFSSICALQFSNVKKVVCVSLHLFRIEQDIEKRVILSDRWPQPKTPLFYSINPN